MKSKIRNISRKVKGDECLDRDTEPPFPSFAIPEAGIKEFMDLYHSTYGVQIDEKDARQRFSELLTLFSLLLRED